MELAQRGFTFWMLVLVLAFLSALAVRVGWVTSEPRLERVAEAQEECPVFSALVVWILGSALGLFWAEKGKPGGRELLGCRVLHVRCDVRGGHLSRYLWGANPVRRGCVVGLRDLARREVDTG